MPLRSTDLKPGELIETEYSPGTTLVKVKSPRSLVALRRIAPVVVWVSRISALTTARSEESQTEPTIVPFVVCAESTAASRKAIKIGRGIGSPWNASFYTTVRIKWTLLSRDSNGAVLRLLHTF